MKTLLIILSIYAIVIAWNAWEIKHAKEVDPDDHNF